MSFPTENDYLDHMKAAPAVQPWLPSIEAYYRHEIEIVQGRVRTNIKTAHIREESGNVRKIDCAALYKQVTCPTLILRADQGLLNENDLLLPEDVIQKMIEKIPDARRFDVRGTNHYGILFQPHPDRDRAIGDFLAADDAKPGYPG